MNTLGQLYIDSIDPNFLRGFKDTQTLFEPCLNSYIMAKYSQN